MELFRSTLVFVPYPKSPEDFSQGASMLTRSLLQQPFSLGVHKAPATPKHLSFRTPMQSQTSLPQGSWQPAPPCPFLPSHQTFPPPDLPSPGCGTKAEPLMSGAHAWHAPRGLLTQPLLHPDPPRCSLAGRGRAQLLALGSRRAGQGDVLTARRASASPESCH